MHLTIQLGGCTSNQSVQSCAVLMSHVGGMGPLCLLLPLLGALGVLLLPVILALF